MPALKIALVARNVPPLHGGGGMLARSIAIHLASRGHSVDILTDTPNPASVPGCNIYSPYDTAPLSSALGRIKRRITEYSWLRKQISSTKYDIIHGVSAQAFTLSAVHAAKSIGIPATFETSLFGNDDFLTVTNSRLGFILKKFYLSADKIVNISPQLEQTCLRGGIPASKLKMIPNPADETVFHPASPQQKSSLRDKLGLSRDSTILFTAGAICHRKGYDRLIDIFINTCQQRPECMLAAAGPVAADQASIKLFKTLKAKLAAAGMNNRVLWLGKIDNVADWMRTSDIFIFASRREGFGTVFTEAMATNLPIVAFEIEGVTEYIFNMPVREHIVEDIDRYQQVLEKHIDDKHLRFVLGKRLYDHYKKHLSANLIIKQYEELFISLINAEKIP